MTVGPIPSRAARLARGLAAAVLGVTLAAGCAAAPSGPQPVLPAPAGQASSSAPAPARATPTVIPEARQGRPARSSRIRFVPESVTLPGGAKAEVQPAETVDGVLQVPEHVQHVGWWDGSAYAGDPFGSTVIAGHVDSATEGIGFFARLLRVKVGQKVTLGGDGHQASYRVVSVQLVDKRALASDSNAFDQTGDHRLVLITCAGSYDRSRGGYSSNLVVTGVPIGLAR